MLVMGMLAGESVWVGGKELVMTDKRIYTETGEWFYFSGATIQIKLDRFHHGRRKIKVAFAAPRSVRIERASVRAERLAKEREREEVAAR